jgi:uncharacterized protein YukE
VTRRAGDWGQFGYDGDPVPASEFDVDVVKREMGDRADEASEIKGILTRLAALDGWRGKAAEDFGDKADEVTGDLGKVAERYGEVEDALVKWRGAVSDARSETKAALDAAETAAETKGEDEKPETGPGGGSGVDEDALRKLTEAMEALNGAAETAKSEIEDAADIWDDGWWGDFKGWVRRNADLIHAIVQVLEIVAAIVGAILLVVAIVATAPFWLVAAAVVLAVAVLVGTVLLVVADTGKADWGDVGWAVVGLAASLVGGKALTSAAKGLKSLVPAMASRIGTSTRGAALTRLIGGNRIQFTNALKIANPRNNLARWVSGLKGTAADEGAAAARRVLDVTRLQPTRLQSVLSQDRTLAQLRRQLSALRGMGPSADEIARMDEIQRNLRIALGTTTFGTGTMLKDLPKNIDTTVDLVTNPPWSTQPTD